MSKHQHILITGGAGFIGSHLAERLLADGQAVVVIDDLSTGSLANLRTASARPHFRFIESTVSACAQLDEVVAGAEAVYHLAAAVGVDLVVNSPIRTISTNLDETEAILSVASRHGVPVLLASTSEVYGKSEKEAFAEDDDLLIGPPYLGRWSYACSKLMDEFLALAHAQERGLPVTVARIFNTVGPRQTGRYGMVLPRFIEDARAGRPLRVFGDGRQTRCFCYVMDTVEALVRLQRCARARGSVFNVGNTTEVTIRQLADEVVRLVDSKSPITLVSYDEAYAPGFQDMLRRRPCIDKLHEFTGFRPHTGLESIIRQTIETSAETPR